MKIDTIGCSFGHSVQKTVDIVPKKIVSTKTENPAKVVDVLPAAGVMGTGLMLFYFARKGFFNKRTADASLKSFSKIV